MFSVLFEVHPRSERWDAYLSYAKTLRPELEKVDGFVDNVRYRSLTREGWLLSLSSWRDEKAVVRWRTHAQHHGIQEKGRTEVFLDYHLRVGQVTDDSRLPPGQTLVEQRLDETEVGKARTVLLIDSRRPSDEVKGMAADEVARGLGLVPGAEGLVAWDVFDAVLTPGDVILLLSWRDEAAAKEFQRHLRLSDGARQR
ncbi:MAG TPA: antibiotic biosynthesis monooxygenase, partial [Myxococcaceae bacterium]|nr:antibiotic biosynthesis monooxygenase [Myxococcaceae bacterium]